MPPTPTEGNIVIRLIKKWITDFAEKFPRAKQGWAVSMALSVIYLGLMLLELVGGNDEGEEGTAAEEECPFSQDGFCVTNLENGTCPEFNNSHFYSFVVDVIFCILVVVLGNSNGAASGTINLLLVVVGLHGALHGAFAYTKCELSGTDDETILFWANVLYAVFIFLVSAVAFFMAGVNIIINIIVSALGTLATVLLSQPSTPFGVSPIFMYTQLLVSALSLLSNVEDVNQFQGDLFILPCAVSIVEMLFCCSDGEPGLFNQFGGHVWYDLALHTALLATYYPNGFFSDYEQIPDTEE